MGKKSKNQKKIEQKEKRKEGRKEERNVDRLNNFMEASCSHIASDAVQEDLTGYPSTEAEIGHLRMYAVTSMMNSTLPTIRGLVAMTYLGFNKLPLLCWHLYLRKVTGMDKKEHNKLLENTKGWLETTVTSMSENKTKTAFAELTTALRKRGTGSTGSSEDKQNGEDIVDYYRRIQNNHMKVYEAERLHDVEQESEGHSGMDKVHQLKQHAQSSKRLGAFHFYCDNITNAILCNGDTDQYERSKILLSNGKTIENDLVPTCLANQIEPAVIMSDEQEVKKFQKGRRFPVSKVDMKFLDKIAVQKDHPIFVAHAHLVLGYYFWRNKANAAKGLYHWQLCLQVLDGVSSNDGKAPLPAGYFGGLVSDCIDYLKQDTKGKIASSCFSLPGSQCDGCGKEVESSHICSRCRRTYYCSRDCQVKHWRENHKECCRKKGEFKNGDHVILTETIHGFLPSGFELILKKRSRDNDTWKASSVIADVQSSVRENQIRVMTPTDKRFLTSYYENDCTLLCACCPRINKKN